MSEQQLTELSDISKQIAELAAEIERLAAVRYRLVLDLTAAGLSQGDLADATGLSRGRFHQLQHKAERRIRQGDTCPDAPAPPQP